MAQRPVHVFTTTLPSAFTHSIAVTVVRFKRPISIAFQLVPTDEHFDSIQLRNRYASHFPKGWPDFYDLSDHVQPECGLNMDV